MPQARLAVSVLLAIGLAGCGGGKGATDGETPLAAALATVSGPEPLGTGYGWIDVDRLRDGERPLRAELDWASGALGPGAREIAAHPGAIERSGVTPLEADSLTSIVTSYALALRLEGIDAERAEAVFVDAGARRSRDGEWTNLDFGAEWTVPDDPRLEPLGSLAARSAVRDETVLLARSPLARESATRTDAPAIDADQVSAAADCLGDVVAARLVLNNHTHLPNSGPDLLAFGVEAGDVEPTREILCALGGSSERVALAASALEETFSAGALDEVSGEPIEELFSNAEIDSYESDRIPVARAKLTAAPGAEPGHLFRAFDRGSLLTYIGLQPPPTPG